MQTLQRSRQDTVDLTAQELNNIYFYLFVYLSLKHELHVNMYIRALAAQ